MILDVIRTSPYQSESDVTRKDSSSVQRFWAIGYDSDRKIFVGLHERNHYISKMLG